MQLAPMIRAVSSLCYISGQGYLSNQLVHLPRTMVHTVDGTVCLWSMVFDKRKSYLRKSGSVTKNRARAIIVPSTIPSGVLCTCKQISTCICMLPLLTCPPMYCMCAWELWSPVGCVVEHLLWWQLAPHEMQCRNDLRNPSTHADPQREHERVLPRDTSTCHTHARWCQFSLAREPGKGVWGSHSQDNSQMQDKWPYTVDMETMP